MAESSGSQAVCITGVGMATSLGRDAVTACAAARAGIVRARELEDFPVRDPETGETSGLVGHPIDELTAGFEGHARLIQIARAALDNLRPRLPDLPAEAAETGLYVSLPDPRREQALLALVADEQTRQNLEKEAARKSALPPAPKPPILASAIQLAGIQPPKIKLAFHSGHVGVAQAFQQAAEDLNGGRVSRAIVGGVDSLIQEDCLAWLDFSDRLKTLESSVGLQPGEAGAFFHLETESRARERGSRILGFVRQSLLAQEPCPIGADEPTRADALCELLENLRKSAGWEADSAWLLTDQNGEYYRALELGHAVHRMAARGPAFAAPIIWYPAASFGETAAASGAVAVAMALHAFQRGCAPAASAAILSSSDDGARAGILISTPNKAA